MSEIVRLIRVSLLLRLVPALAAFAFGLLSDLENNALLLGLITVLPSVAVLGATYATERRSGLTSRNVRVLLAAVIIVYAVESLFPLIANQFMPLRGWFAPRVFVGGPGRPPDAPAPEDPAAFTERDFNRVLGAFFTVPLLFSLIPTVLGAWLEGKRGWWRWAALTIALNLISIAAVVIASGQAQQIRQLQFNLGGAMAQSLVIAVVCYFVASLADQLRNEQRQLETANKQLAEQAHVREQLAGSRERVRLARDLHDTLAHTLAGLVVQMNAIGTLLDKQPDAAKAELKKAQGVAKTGLEETRAAISDLRANVVEDLGLSGALKRLTELAGQRIGAQVHFEQHGDEPALEQAAAESIFRIAQEAMNNVERHAGAKHVTVRLVNDDTRATTDKLMSSVVHRPSSPSRALTLTIRDDGVGFDVAALESDRFGLRGMRERAELIGAYLRIDSALKQGTTVTLTLKPL